MITMVARMHVSPANQPAYEAVLDNVAAQVRAHEAEACRITPGRKASMILILTW